MTTKQDKREFRDYCHGITPTQLRNVLIKETLARRTSYAQIAREVMKERAMK
jgi:Iap family predicted aminopeptidase